MAERKPRRYGWARVDGAWHYFGVDKLLSACAAVEVAAALTLLARSDAKKRKGGLCQACVEHDDRRRLAAESNALTEKIRGNLVRASLSRSKR